MADIIDYILDPKLEREPPAVVDRKAQLPDWDEVTALRVAGEQGLLLTEEHWRFIDYLRRYYIRHGWPSHGYELSQRLQKDFADRGGKRYLHHLFPRGPLTQGSEIAGLPRPRGVRTAQGAVQ